MHRVSILLVAMSLVGCGGAPADVDVRRSLSVRDVLSAPASGLEQALAPRRLAFPDDHGPHPDYRAEWWYFTGTLRGPGGERFGYQLTFFRVALAATTRAVDAPASPGAAAAATPAVEASSWRTRQAWMAHLALSDAGAGRFQAFERLSRQALGLAGARAAPFRVWLEDWSATSAPATDTPVGEDPAARVAATAATEVSGEAATIFPLHLQAAAEDIAIDLRLAAVKPVVLHGEDGWSRKGDEPGNASYYYSFTRLSTTGTVHLAGRRFPVRGTSWLDREWSTGALEAEQVGWDWLALQLDDGSEVMVYRLRNADGSTNAHSAGTLIEADGTATALPAGAIDLEALGTWNSPRGGTYPSGWRLRLAGHDLEVDIEPLLADQELPFTFRYWEGAVQVRGRRGGAPLAGHGYVELTGYADDSPLR